MISTNADGVQVSSDSCFRPQSCQASRALLLHGNAQAQATGLRVNSGGRPTLRVVYACKSLQLSCDSGLHILRCSFASFGLWQVPLSSVQAATRHRGLIPATHYDTEAKTGLASIVLTFAQRSSLRTSRFVDSVVMTKGRA